MRQISDKQVTKLASLIVSLQGLLESLESQKYALTEEATQRLAKLTSNKACLFCELPLDGGVRRGCHQSCYNKVQAAIRRGEVTEQIAIEVKAWITPEAARPGRKSNRPDPIRDGRKPSVLAAEASLDLQERKKAGRDKRRDKEKPKA
jgi:hypothetical protein